MKYAEHISTTATPQREPIPGRTDQVVNSEGGYVFEVDPFMQLRRFLILGAEGGGSSPARRQKLVVAQLVEQKTPARAFPAWHQSLFLSHVPVAQW
jgi:hypothetical protein